MEDVENPEIADQTHSEETNTEEYQNESISESDEFMYISDEVNVPRNIGE